MSGEPPSDLPVVVLTGTPLERGRVHGRRLRGEIVAAIDRLKQAQGNIGFVAARRKAESAWPMIRELAPDVASEIAGIADGSGASVSDVLLRSGFEFFDAPPVSGCSAVALTGAKGAIVGQNWDAPPAAVQEFALFLHVGPGGFECAVVASCGGLCWVGGNGSGLALVNNDLLLLSTAVGLPSQIVRRLVLAEPSVEKALGRLKSLPHAGGRSYLLGDASGAVAGVEVSARFGVFANQTESPVLHTNHALHPDVAGDQSEALLQSTHPSSRMRYDVLRRKSPALPTVDAVAALLSDRENYPNSVAKAVSPEEPTATLFSVIFDCGEQALFLCAGVPGDRPYQRIAW